VKGWIVVAELQRQDFETVHRPSDNSISRRSSEVPILTTDSFIELILLRSIIGNQTRGSIHSISTLRLTRPTCLTLPSRPPSIPLCYVLGHVRPSRGAFAPSPLLLHTPISHRSHRDTLKCHKQFKKITNQNPVSRAPSQFHANSSHVADQTSPLDFTEKTPLPNPNLEVMIYERTYHMLRPLPGGSEWRR
jgi:hypothetical protein